MIGQGNDQWVGVGGDVVAMVPDVGMTANADVVVVAAAAVDVVVVVFRKLIENQVRG